MSKKVQGSVAGADAGKSNAIALAERALKTRADAKAAEEEKKEEAAATFKKGAADVVGAVSQAASFETKGLITGIGHALDVWTVGISGIVGELAGAAISFKDKVKGAALEVQDSMDAFNTSLNYTGERNFLRSTPGDFKDRKDIAVDEQRAIVSALGNQYGRFSKEFSDSIRNLYGQRGGEGRPEPFDIRQTTEIAKGKFSALGTDQGYFLEKIANGLQDLPPSIKQALLPQLFSQVKAEDRFKQTDEGIRTSNVNFNDLERARALAIASNTNIESAKQIQEIQNSIDTGLATAIGSLTDALRAAAQAITKKANEFAADKRAGGDPFKATKTFP